jgi:hypothetical protein
MARELYMRDPTDPNYKSGIMEINDEVDMLVSQIKMILYTKPGEILGAPDFGVALEDQLFVFNINEYALKSMLFAQVAKFVPLSEKYHIKFNVTFARGTVRDMCIIDVVINGNPMFGMLVK